MNSSKRTTLLLFCCTLFALTTFATLTFAQGGADDPNGEFQLEGNTSTDGSICFGIVATGPAISTPNPGCPSGQNLVTFGSSTEDWDKIFAAQTGGSTVAVATDFATDAFNSSTDDIFTGGSTKDTNDFSTWMWKNGKPQAKDDFEHAYAAAYSRSSDSHLFVFAGVDRYDNSGSSTAGFWFAQDSAVGTGDTGTCGGGSGCAFGGTHKDGDILIISAFTTGGTVSTIQVFTWSGNGASGSITGPNVTGTQCDPRSGSATLCGTVNGVPVLTGGWTFSSKPSDATTCSTTGTGPGTQAANCMSTGEFLEVGLDLTALATQLGKPVPCISRFFAESRSSGTGISSTLSDVVLPTKSFNVCSITATKTCDPTKTTINDNGTGVHWAFTGTITGKGGTFTEPSGGWIADKPDSCPNYIGGSGQNGNVCTNGNNQVNNLVIVQPSQTTLPPGPSNSISYSGSFETNFDSSSLDNLAQASGVTPEGVTLTGPANGASWLGGSPPSNGCAPPIIGKLSLTKSCMTTVTVGSPLTIEVDFSGTITNNANQQVQNITIVDAPSATITITSCTSANGCSGSLNGSFTLNPGGFASYSGSYTETGSGISCTLVSPGRCQFSDTATASGTGALTQTTVDSGMGATAMCNLCPAGSCGGP